MPNLATPPTPPSQPPNVLTIAGSDSGGAAGLQADVRTLAACGVYGLCAITAVTAQNSLGVQSVQFMPPDFVAAQMTAVLTDYGASAVKTGFLGQADLVTAVAATLDHHPIPHIVIDPVLVNHRGEAMFPDALCHQYRHLLLPRATLLTPNLAEAALLLETAVPDRHDLPALAQLARQLHQLGPRHVLLKGGRDGSEIVDIFYDGSDTHQLRSKGIDTANTHGAGDTLSAAAAAFLAQGDGMATAVAQAHTFTARAIARGAAWHLGAGHGPVVQWGE